MLKLENSISCSIYSYSSPFLFKQARLLHCSPLKGTHSECLPSRCQKNTGNTKPALRLPVLLHVMLSLIYSSENTSKHTFHKVRPLLLLFSPLLLIFMLVTLVAPINRRDILFTKPPAATNLLPAALLNIYFQQRWN